MKKAVSLLTLTLMLQFPTAMAQGRQSTRTRPGWTLGHEAIIWISHRDDPFRWLEVYRNSQAAEDAWHEQEQLRQKTMRIENLVRKSSALLETSFELKRALENPFIDGDASKLVDKTAKLSREISKLLR